MLENLGRSSFQPNPPFSYVSHSIPPPRYLSPFLFTHLPPRFSQPFVSERNSADNERTCSNSTRSLAKQNYTIYRHFLNAIVNRGSARSFRFISSSLPFFFLFSFIFEGGGGRSIVSREKSGG